MNYFIRWSSGPCDRQLGRGRTCSQLFWADIRLIKADKPCHCHWFCVADQGGLEGGRNRLFHWKDMKLLCAHETRFLLPTQPTQEKRHTTPEWANQQKSCPEKWYTTYCQGPLGLPKNAFGQIWELNFLEKNTFFWFVRKCQTKPFRSPNIWNQGSILTHLKNILSNNFRTFF